MTILMSIAMASLSVGNLNPDTPDAFANGASSVILASEESANAAFEPEPQTPTGKFLNATEVKQILPHTKAQWVAVRPYEGSDLLYFTNLLAWRCGLHQIRFAVNGGEMQTLEMEPCYSDEGVPNALKIDGNILPYVGFPLDSIETIQLELLYDDMTTEAAEFERSQVQIN